VVAEYQNDLPRFFKRFQIQPVWRADRPAKGRFREFFQCDVDIVGSESLVCEVEVASAVCEVLDGLGFSDYAVRLNHRGLLRGMIESAGIPLEKEVEAITALDKLDKLGVDGVKQELAGRGIAEASAGAQLASEHGADGERLLAALGSQLAGSEAGSRGVKELQQLLAYAKDAPCGRRLKIDPSLARGLSYYTGPIFEVAVPDLAGSLGGGGRYDNLIGMFMGKSLPAVGFSLGLERILVVMEERKMFPPLDAAAQVMVFRIEEQTTAETLRLCATLRAGGIATELYPTVDKLGKQFQYAQVRGARVAAFIGTSERDAGTVVFKQLASQQQIAPRLSEALEALRPLLT
jgi:histidyl-tRNA synthetase